MDWKKVRAEIKAEKITKKQKRKQIYKMLLATLIVGGIFALGYAVIILVGFLMF